MTQRNRTQRKTDDELIQELIETTVYSGDVGDWRDAPETGWGEDEPESERPAGVRAMAEEEEE